ncbi:hypothetical protein GPALN_010335 [Globodera pallida]|nr:hypothetical protein GPALN_010335 [Globodera pallida]
MSEEECRQMTTIGSNLGTLIEDSGIWHTDLKIDTTQSTTSSTHRFNQSGTTKIIPQRQPGDGRQVYGRSRVVERRNKNNHQSSAGQSRLFERTGRQNAPASASLPVEMPRRQPTTSSSSASNQRLIREQRTTWRKGREGVR